MGDSVGGRRSRHVYTVYYGPESGKERLFASLARKGKADVLGVDRRFAQQLGHSSRMVAYSEVGQISNGKSRLAFIDESAIDIAGGQTGSYVPCFMRRFPDRCIKALG